jgi:hypothetical protein
MGWIKKLLRLEGYKKDAEKVTHKELTDLISAKREFDVGWGYLQQQFDNEKNVTNPRTLDQTAAIGFNFKKAHPKLIKTLALLQLAKEVDKKVKKVVHSFHSLAGSEVQNDESTVASFSKLFDDLDGRIRKLAESCKTNQELGEEFEKEWAKKGKVYGNFDPTTLLSKLKTTSLQSEAEKISKELQELIEKLEKLLALEELLPEVKKKPGRKLVLKQ